MNLRQVFIAAAAAICLVGAGFWLGGATAATAEPGSAADPLVSKSYVDGLILFQVVDVPKGKQLIGESGTEIVLRGGQATAIASPNGGMLDATAGTDVTQGLAIKPNHLLVVPRSDGRGILAKTDVIAMVKGPHSLK